MIDMQKILNFFVSNWRPIVWTIGYAMIIWLVLYGLFGFNMFSGAHLSRLLRLHLHGFGGLVFGLLILAAVPLYVATTVLVVRNKAVPIKIPVPNCFNAPAAEPEQAPQPEPIVAEREVLPVLPRGVPQEMRESFMRARKNYGARQMSVFNKTPLAGVATDTPVSQTVHEVVPEPEPLKEFKPVFDTIDDVQDMKTGLPIPEDFDVADESDVPVFQDIDFDDEYLGDDEAPDESGNLLDFLTKSGVNAVVQDNLVIANGFAIAAHTDDDFWVADELDWFGAGRQKPSPVAALLKVKDKFKPVLYLTATNIMDFDKMVADWRDNGITVITDRDELLKFIQA